MDVVKKEEAFLTHLEDLARYFATPLLLRDTPFKRDCMDEVLTDKVDSINCLALPM